jgi:hypothetical protein
MSLAEVEAHVQAYKDLLAEAKALGQGRPFARPKLQGKTRVSVPKNNF